MADILGPRTEVQIAVIPATKCELCETNDIQFKCFTCEENTYMCNGCKIAHKKSPVTRDHKITSTRGSDPRDTVEGGNRCGAHPTEDVVMYCKACNYPVCMDCIASESHQQHKLTKIQDAINGKQEELSKIIDDANIKLSAAEYKIKLIRKMGNEYTKDVNGCRDKAKARNVQLKSILDQITSEVIDNLEDNEKQYQDAMEKEGEKTENEILSLKEIIKNSKEQQEKGTAEIFRFASNVKNQLGLLQVSDMLSQPDPPTFVTKNVDQQQLKVLFGESKQQNERTSDTERSKEAKVKVMSKFAMTNSGRIAAVSDTRAWVKGWGCKEIAQVTSDGRVLQSVITDFDICDMAVTTKGELLLTVLRGNKVKKMISDGEFTDVYTAPKGHQTQGIAVTDDNHIIVGLYAENLSYFRYLGLGKEQAKVVKLSPSGELLQTIQYDSNGKSPLFENNNPWSVSGNINGDIIVQDAYTLVAVDKTGQKRFTFKGGIPGVVKFKPQYIVTDRYGNILVSDSDSRSIYLLDSEGKFLQFILAEQHQTSPVGMSIDKSGRLWVYDLCQQVMIVEYEYNNSA